MWNELFEDGHQKLVKTYTFDGFKSALDFVMEVAELAEAQQHHPDILIEHNKVTLKCWTHDTGTVTAKDTAFTEALDGAL